MRDGDPASDDTWRPGFQERFLAGYLLLGLVLLLVIGHLGGQGGLRPGAR